MTSSEQGDTQRGRCALGDRQGGGGGSLRDSAFTTTEKGGSRRPHIWLRTTLGQDGGSERGAL